MVKAEKIQLPKYHKLNITVEEKIIYKKGRPKNGQKGILETRTILAAIYALMRI